MAAIIPLETLVTQLFESGATYSEMLGQVSRWETEPASDIWKRLTQQRKPAMKITTDKLPTGKVHTNPQRRNKTTTGDRPFDASRIKTRGIDEKPDKAARGSFVSVLGDLVDAAFSFLLDPNTLMVVGYAGFGLCLTFSVRSMLPLAASLVGYAGLGPLTGVVSLLGAAGLAFITQFIEILPRLQKYFPTQGNKLVLKLSMNRVFQGKERQDSPTLLPEANKWTKDAHRKMHSGLETASLFAYILEACQALTAFSVFAAGSLSPIGVFSVIAAVFGPELCLGFVGWMKEIRLTTHESRRYNEIRRRKRLEAESDLT